MSSCRLVSLSVVVLSALILLSCVGLVKNNQSQPGPTPSPSPSPVVQTQQLLYVLSNGSLATYTIDPKALTAQAVGAPVNLAQTSPNVGPQLVASPDGHFLYLVWVDLQAQGHISAFATNASGVPQIPAIQTLDVSPQPQLLMHPSGSFAYLLDTTPVGNMEVSSSLRLLHVDSATGKLTEDPQFLSSYGPDTWSAGLFGWNADGTQLYDTWAVSFHGSNTTDYRQRTVNSQTGALGAEVPVYSVSYSWANQGEIVAIGSKIIVDFFMGSGGAVNTWLNIFPNSPNPPLNQTPLINCTSTMFGPCSTAAGVQLDNSGKYLFFNDPVSQKIRVARIDLSASQVVDTGSSIPSSQAGHVVVFSTDGTLVYTIPWDNSVPLQIYSFDAGSGKLTPGSSLALPAVYDGVYSVERH